LSPKKDKVLIRTPGITTIDALCEFLLIETSEVAKTLIFTVDRGNPRDTVTLFAVLRGDTTLNFKKLIGALQLLNINNMESIRLGTEDEIRGCGAVPGFASPIGLDSKKIITIVDTLVAKSSNLIAGANQENFHFQNTNYQIDYSADLVFDIHMAESGMSCKYCGESLALEKGFTIGHVEKLLNFDTAGTKCRFLDNTGRDKAILIGYYQLNLFNLLMCIAEEHHDDFGLKWPINVSPYYVHLIKLNSKNEEVDKVTNDLYEALRYANLMPLYDDRDERAGVKFTDADLIGLPYSVLVSSKSLNQGGVELRSRDKTFQQILSPDNAVKVLCEEVNPA
jgi:prolyl-tRNA synthetase